MLYFLVYSDIALAILNLDRVFNVNVLMCCKRLNISIIYTKVK